MNNMVPTKVFFTQGVGVHKDKLASFEAALRDAGIEKYNLVYVSSILPPNCQVVTKEYGTEVLPAGSIVFCVMARMETNEHNRLLASSIGVARHTVDTYGYLSEHHSYGETAKVAGEYSEDLAATMLATTLGIEFDADKDWNEREQIYKSSGYEFTSKHFAKSAVGKAGLWTTVISAAVFIMGE